jgi:surface protein
MFNDCMAFKTIDLTGWNTSNVIAFSQMFEGCEALEEIIGLETWDTSSGKNFGEMFRYCHNLKELNLSSFDTRNATHTYKHPNSEYGVTNIFGPEMYRLEKVTLGENWTFLGDGGCSKGYFTTPSADYIDGADGNWYTIDGTAYAPADIPNLTYATYYASPTIVDAVIWDRDSKKYMHLSAMKAYHDLLNADIDTKLDVIRQLIPDIVVDSELSDTSVNPVQNKVINETINMLSSAVAHIDVESNETVITLEELVRQLEAIENGTY